MACAPAYPVYLAVLPDQTAREQMAALIRQFVSEHGFTHGLQGLDRLHMTMLHLGTWHGLPGDILARIGIIAARLDWPPRRIRFDRAGNLGREGGRRHLVLRSADRPQALFDLRRDLVFAARMAGLSPKSSGFEPHVTLVYNHQRPVPTRAIDPIEWVANELVLIQSIVGERRHVKLGSIPSLPMRFKDSPEAIKPIISSQRRPAADR